jgi:hypothetical protein
MNYFIILSIIVIIILLWFKQNEIDSDIINGWWITSNDFNEKSGLDYMYINFTKLSDNYSCYIIAADESGLLYNMPFKMKLSLKNNEKIKARYNLTLESDEELPFNNSELILDRTNCTISILKDNVLFAFLQKNTN